MEKFFRKLEICEACPEFFQKEYKNGKKVIKGLCCNAKGNRISYLQGVGGFPITKLEAPSIEPVRMFEQKKIPSDCAMYTEYCVDNWNE